MPWRLLAGPGCQQDEPFESLTQGQAPKWNQGLGEFILPASKTEATKMKTGIKTDFGLALQMKKQCMCRNLSCVFGWARS